MIFQDESNLLLLGFTMFDQQRAFGLEHQACKSCRCLDQCNTFVRGKDGGGRMINTPFGKKLRAPGHIGWVGDYDINAARRRLKGVCSIDICPAQGHFLIANAHSNDVALEVGLRDCFHFNAHHLDRKSTRLNSSHT